MSMLCPTKEDKSRGLFFFLCLYSAHGYLRSPRGAVMQGHVCKPPPVLPYQAVCGGAPVNKKSSL